MKSFVRGLPASPSPSPSLFPSSSSSLLSLFATRRFLLLSLLIAYGRSESEEESSNADPNADPVALLRGTLKFWRRVYSTYQQEMSLGYCWADYLFDLGGFGYPSSPHSFPTDFTSAETSWKRRNGRNGDDRARFVHGNDSRSLVDARFGGSRRGDESKTPKKITRDEEEGKSAFSILRNNSNEGRRIGEAYQVARNIFDEVTPSSSDRTTDLPERSRFLVGRKVFDRDKETVYAGDAFAYSKEKEEERKDGIEDLSRSETSREREKRDISDRTEAVSSLSTKKYELRADEGRNEVRRNDIIFEESQGRRESSEKLVIRGRSVKRTLLSSTLAEHPIFIAVLRSLTLLIRLARLIMEIVDSSKVLRCTKDYLWAKAFEWIDA